MAWIERTHQPTSHHDGIVGIDWFDRCHVGSSAPLVGGPAVGHDMLVVAAENKLCLTRMPATCAAAAHALYVVDHQMIRHQLLD